MSLNNKLSASAQATFVVRLIQNLDFRLTPAGHLRARADLCGECAQSLSKEVSGNGEPSISWEILGIKKQMSASFLFKGPDYNPGYCPGCNKQIDVCDEVICWIYPAK